MGGGIGWKGWLLVAEDDSPSRLGTVELLSGAGYRVDVARDGAEALEFFAELPPDDPLPNVLLTDLDMPRVTGGELVTLLRNDPRYARLCIIVLSTFEGQQAPPPNVQRLIAKPVKGDELLRIIAEHCSREPSGQ